MKKYLIYVFCFFVSGFGMLFSGGCRSHKDITISERDSLKVTREAVHVLKAMEISDIMENKESSKVNVEFEDGKGEINYYPDGKVGISGVKTLTGNEKSASKCIKAVKMEQDSLAAEMETWRESARIEDKKSPERSERIIVRITALIAIVVLLFIIGRLCNVQKKMSNIDRTKFNQHKRI